MSMFTGPLDTGRVAVFAAIVAVIATMIIVAQCPLTSFNVPTRGYHTEPPVLCPGGDREPFDEAVAWWRDLGFPIEIACDTTTDVVFRYDPTVRTADSVDSIGDTYELTRVQLDEDGRILEVEVDLAVTGEAIVYAHAIGHALGFEHGAFLPSGHVMDHRAPGWDGRGCDPYRVFPGMR